MNILAIGAHVGDAELMTGPLLIEEISKGNSATILALTPGELGNPNVAAPMYRTQKISENKKFCEEVGAKSIIFDDLKDGFLLANAENALRVARIIREERPEEIFTHWSGSFHPDHRNTHHLVKDAIFIANLPLEDEKHPPFLAKLYFSENWEDMSGFEVSEYRPISTTSYGFWRKAIENHEFAHGQTSGFRYIDYYTALMTMRGCLSKTFRAVGLMKDPLTPLL
jgi:LmbE family N-acetylglucosaminyl deacetylase